MIRIRRAAPALLLLLALVAGLPARAASVAGPSGFDAWLAHGDPVAASVRFRADAVRDPSDPWPLLGEAMLAERSLDEDAEAGALLALVAAAPRHPLALVALRRLGELSLASPPVADRVDEALARALGGSNLPGTAAYRARVVRAAIAEMRGAYPEAAVMRARNGVANAWTLAGPFGAYHALELDRPFPPEQGAWPPPGARALPAPDGAFSLDGESVPGDVWYVAADAVLARGGRYLLAVGTTASIRVFLDGKPVAERRAWAGWPSAVQLAKVELSPGTHRFLVKLTRGAGRANLALTLARDDGSDADVTWAAATGPGPAVTSGELLPTVLGARALAEALEPDGGPVLSRLVAARDRVENDRQAALVAARRGRGTRSRRRAGPGRPGRRARRRSDPGRADGAGARRRPSGRRRLASIPGAPPPGSSSPRWPWSEAGSTTPRRSSPRLPEKAGREAAGPARAGAAPRRAEPSRRPPRAWCSRPRGRGAAPPRPRSPRWPRGATRSRSRTRPPWPVAGAPAGRSGSPSTAFLRGDLPAAAAAWSAIARAAPARIDARTGAGPRARRPGEPGRGRRPSSSTWPGSGLPTRRSSGAWGRCSSSAGRRSAARAARERALALDGVGPRSCGARSPSRTATRCSRDLAVDGPATIRAYEAARVPVTTPASLVLDAAAVEAWPDGSTTERTHQVIHVHDARGVEKWGEVEVPPGATLLKLETRKRDGRVLEPEVHGGDKRTLSAAGLEPGDYLELEWLRSIPTRRPASPGWLSDPFFFRGEDLPFFLSTYTVAAPAGELQLDVRNMPSPPVVREGNRDVMRAEAQAGGGARRRAGVAGDLRVRAHGDGGLRGGDRRPGARRGRRLPGAHPARAGRSRPWPARSASPPASRRGPGRRCCAPPSRR